jgi:hypothetical protein
VKVTDDVTKDNSDLISKLLENGQISGAWYFNGAVYGQCNSCRIKFNLFDGIDKRNTEKVMHFVLVLGLINDIYFR